MFLSSNGKRLSPKEAKIEQYRKVHAKGILKETNRLNNFYKQPKVVAEAAANISINLLNDEGDCLKPNNVLNENGGLGGLNANNCLMELSEPKPLKSLYIDSLENSSIVSNDSMITFKVGDAPIGEIGKGNFIDIGSCPINSNLLKLGSIVSDSNSMNDGIDEHNANAFNFKVGDAPSVEMVNVKDTRGDINIVPDNKIFKLSDIKPDLFNLLEPFIDGLGAGGIGGLTDKALLMKISDKEYELNEKVIVADFIAFVKHNCITCISNVYQETYANGKNATGFGDYIRGCYFLIQFCNYISKAYSISITPLFNIHHQLGQFLSAVPVQTLKDTSKVDLLDLLDFKENKKTEMDRWNDIVAFDKYNWKGTQFNDGLIVDDIDSKNHVLHFMNYLMYDGVINSSLLQMDSLDAFELKHLDDYFNVFYSDSKLDSSTSSYREDVKDENEDVKDKGTTIYIYTISFPLWPLHISEEAKEQMIKVLTPCESLDLYIKNVMINELSLTGLNPPTSHKQYIVIHVRCGDLYLANSNKMDKEDEPYLHICLEDKMNEEFSLEYKEKLIKLIQSVIELNVNENGLDCTGTADDEMNGMDVLLIADNNDIKDIIKGEFPFIKSVKKNIGHFGEGYKQENDKIKNTLLDFFLISKASKVISFTSYAHGSGFSRWCAETFNIPYLCYFV